MTSGGTDQAKPIFRSTTILAIRRSGRVVVIGDGQVCLGNTVMKGGARKVRTLQGGKILGGFAGSAADGLALFERLEAKLSEHGGRLRRAAVEMAKDWRTDRYLRRLEAMMIVADRETSLVLSGTGDVLEPDDGVMGIGSGGNYALAAAKALADRNDMDARAVAARALGPRRRNLRLHPQQFDDRDPMTNFSPREIAQELDKHIIGQQNAKRAVAIALRNRWRRMQVDEGLRNEITPKNILMIGPTGVGKTEISRRLAKLAKAPFIKVEATKFTEVGYVGREVDSIVRDLVEVAIHDGA